MGNNEKDIKSQMDSDKGFQSKRRVLVILPILFIGIKLSGIKIIEANTFILKLSITNENAIGQLIFYAMIYTFVRYHTYAHKYHTLLYESWSQKLLADDFFLNYDYHAELLDGLIVDKFPQNDAFYNYIRKESNSHKTKYECRSIFKRYFVYSWKDENGEDETDKVNLHEYFQFKSKWLKWANNKIRKPGLLSLKIIRKEIHYQFKSYMYDREQLDLFAPYVLASFAFSCQFHSSTINSFLGISP